MYLGESNTETRTANGPRKWNPYYCLFHPSVSSCVTLLTSFPDCLLSLNNQAAGEARWNVRSFSASAV
jgi:hypothetical protein